MTFLPFFSTTSKDKSTQQREGKKGRDGAKGKELGYKTCDWHLTFVLFIPKCGMKKILPEVSAMPFLPYAPGHTFYNWCFEALIQSHPGNLISLTSLVFPWP